MHAWTKYINRSYDSEVGIGFINVDRWFLWVIGLVVNMCLLQFDSCNVAFTFYNIVCLCLCLSGGV